MFTFAFLLSSCSEIWIEEYPNVRNFYEWKVISYTDQLYFELDCCNKTFQLKDYELSEPVEENEKLIEEFIIGRFFECTGDYPWTKNNPEQVSCSTNDETQGWWEYNLWDILKNRGLVYAIWEKENLDENEYIEDTEFQSETQEISWEATGMDSYAFNQEIILKIWDEVIIEGTDLRIKFNWVLEDSRCPTWSQCFWAWQSIVELVFIRPWDVQTSEFNLWFAGESTSTILDLYFLKILSLNPYPDVSKEIKPRDYELKIILSEK